MIQYHQYMGQNGTGQKAYSIAFLNEPSERFIFFTLIILIIKLNFFWKLLWILAMIIHSLIIAPNTLLSHIFLIKWYECRRGIT